MGIEFKIVERRCVVELSKAEGKTWQPKEKIPFLGKVDIERSFFEDQTETFPCFKFVIAFFSHSLCDLAVYDASDIIHLI